MSACYLTFDVEDWFHAHNLRPQVDRDDWEDCEFRVEKNVQKILNLLDRYDTKATFFVLGWVADRIPAVVEAIVDGGHEVASHGYNHELLYRQSVPELRRDFEQSLEALEPHIVGSIRGYRAPSFSITDQAMEVLSQLGFEYDSSSFVNSFHHRYGELSASVETDATTDDDDILEVQLQGLNILETEIPWAGGGYFRFIPYRMFRHGIRRIADEGDYVFYLHPWELDPGQPRFEDLPLSYPIRHYTNLGATERRLERLLSDFDWQPMERALD